MGSREPLFLVYKMVTKMVTLFIGDKNLASKLPFYLLAIVAIMRLKWLNSYNFENGTQFAKDKNRRIFANGFAKASMMAF